MKPTIETSRLRANLRLSAEMGHIPQELVSVIERDLGLDYVEEQFKKKYKHGLKCFGKAMADLLDEYNLFISMPFGKWQIVGDGILMTCDGFSFCADTFRKLNVIDKKNKRINERVRSECKTVDDARAVITEENDRIQNFVQHGID